MKFVLDNWMLIAVVLTSGAMLFWPMINAAGAGSLSVDLAVQRMNRDKAVVIDVCEPKEFAQAHIAGAKNIPLSELAAKLPGAVKNKEQSLILVCQSGSRSRSAVAIAKKLGYTQAESMAGGMGAWRSANLPIRKA